MNGFGFGFSAALGTLLNQTYDPLKDETVAFRSVGRNGLVMEDLISTNDAQIQLPYLFRGTASGYATITDNGALDIGATNFTLCGWVKDVGAGTGQASFFGKGVVGSQANQYEFGTYPTTRKIYLVVQTGTENFTLQSNIVSNTTDWHFLYLEIDQTAKKLRWFIDNEQIGSDTSFTGTFSALDNKFKFRIGGRNATDGSIANLSATSFSDIRIYNSLLTTEQRTILFNRGDVAGAKLHLPLSALVIHDISGNNYHPATTSLTSANIAYGAYGSRQALSFGYSVWKSPGLPDVQIPLKSDGTAITTTLLAETYYHSHDVAGSLTGHNKAESYILFTHGNFDRSDTDIYSDYCRSARTKYNAAIPKQWHISELIALEIKYNSTDDYNAITFPAYTADVLTEIISVSTKKTATDLKKILEYTNNYESWHDIEYYVDDRNIVCTHGDYMLIYDAANSKLQISSDLGVSILREISVTGFSLGVKFAYIFEDGKIMFANETKMFYSHDLLQSIHESSALDINGDPYSSPTNDGFTRLSPDNYFKLNGVEMPVWGVYTTRGNYRWNINCFYTIDNGITVKSFLHFNGDGSTSSVAHIHAINFNESDNSFWIQTGDDGGASKTCRWYKATYNTGTDVWTVTLISSSDVLGYYKTEGMAFVDSSVIWSSDSVLYGIWSAQYNDIANDAKYVKLTPPIANGVVINNYVLNLVNFENNIICVLPLSSTMMISTDGGVTWFSHLLRGLPSLDESGFPLLTIYPPNSNGYHLIHLVETGETCTDDWTLGKVLMLKITKPV